MSAVTFNEIQKDAIIELINLGIGRAADALAQMIKEEVLLSVPDIEFVKYSQLGDYLSTIDNQQPSVVMQEFKGEFNGNALLVFPESSGMSLVRQMLTETVSDDEISELEEEALIEIGNIILNACFGQVADLLSTRLNGEIPVFINRDIDTILAEEKSIKSDKDNTYIMLLQVDFSMKSSNTRGFVIFIMDVISMNIFKQKIEAYLKKVLG